MDKTGKSLGRVLTRCQEQLMEGSKQEQRAQASIAHLEDVICAVKKLGTQASATGLDIDDSQKLQVQALAYELGSIGPVRRALGSDKGARNDREIDGLSGSLASSNPFADQPPTGGSGQNGKTPTQKPSSRVQSIYARLRGSPSNHITSEADKFRFLAEFDTVFLIDDSVSMTCSDRGDVRFKQGFDIGPIDKSRPVGHGICIECRTVIVAGFNEISGVRGTGSSGPSYASQKTSSQSTSGSTNKGPDSHRREWGRDRGNNNQPPQRQKKQQSESSNSRFSFGCPFYFHDKEEHQSCLNYKLKRIGDVRQHIWRFHVQPSHCPRCGIVFPNDINYAQRDTHERQRTCEVTNDVRRCSGATSDQLASMNNAATHRCSSTEERWYVIFEIMFPNAERPPSPYVDIRREWSCIEVHAAVTQYRQNGGLEDFTRQWGSGFDMLLNHFLNHFRDYNRTAASAANPGGARDTLSNTYMISEIQSTIPSPPLRTQPHLVPQPIASPRVVLPVLAPEPPQINSPHIARSSLNLNPNLHPNIDAEDELGPFNESFFDDTYYFGDSYSHGGDSDAI
ncbi:hypothetical protein F4679DRAFT_544855 [Xylaria curta]|nr:hypothetical protein F4679DRAFT_544855 [Xylaria curta]